MESLDKNRPSWGVGEVLKLSFPASLSMLSGTIMMFVDGLMVAGYSPTALAAQGIGGIMSFVPTSFALGMLTSVNTFVSQNLGAGRLNRCGQYAWAGMIIAVLLSVLAIPLLIGAEFIFKWFPHTDEVKTLETMYFSYMIAGMSLFLCSRVLEQFFFGIHRSGIVMVSAFAANICNIGADWVLIYGKFGLPAMGLEGAAIGTLGSTALLLVIMLLIFICPSMHRKFDTRSAGKAKLDECLDITRIGWPAGVQFLNDILSWSAFNAILVGLFGTAHLVASITVMRFMQLSFMPAVGVGIATTALVGRYIGMGRLSMAKRRAHTAVTLCMTYMGLCGLAFWLFGEELVRWYITLLPAQGEETGVSIEQVVSIGGGIMICAAVFQLFDAIGIVFVGALRGAGDTLWPMFATIILCWSIIVGGGILMIHFFPDLESLGPWIVASAYVILLGPVLAWRFESGKWRKIDLLKKHEYPIQLTPPQGPI